MSGSVRSSGPQKFTTQVTRLSQKTGYLGFRSVGCELSANILAAFENELKRGSMDLGAFAERIGQIAVTMHQEIDGQTFFWIPQAKASFLKKTGEQLLSAEVLVNYPGIERDVLDAVRCYAYDQNTACAYHLMRVMEPCVHAFGKTIGFTNANPNWGEVFRHYDAERARNRGRNASGVWAIHGDFLNEVAGTLNAVKDAWRNPTMHGALNCDENDAHHLLVVVPALVRRIGAKIDSSGRFV